jgi:3-(3-hydroxy-phenyl)propionate hydroxylase
LAFLHDRVVPLIGNAEPVQRLITDFVSELGIEYRSSSLTLTDKRNGPAQPGNRAPDAIVSVTSGPREWRSVTRIFDLIDPTKFTLLLFDPGSPAGISGNDQAAAALSEALPQALDVWHVRDANVPAIATPYGTQRPSFCLIRPDGYVMLRGTPADADSAAEFCRRVFNLASV